MSTVKPAEILEDEPAQISAEELEYVRNFPLLETDDIPLETSWHRDEIGLLIESVRYRFRDRTDFYVGGNTFVYYNLEQAATRKYRGPDFFFVSGVPLHPLRRYWVVWQEGGRYPDVIMELLSPSTAAEDRTTKKEIYEQTFRTPEYFLYDPITKKLEGFRLGANCRYEPIQPNERGWLWSAELGLWVGTWDGEYLLYQDTWVRFYDTEGRLVPIPAEAAAQQAESERQRAETEHHRAEAERQRVEVERQRAEAERQRAEIAEAELQRLRALLTQQGLPPEPPA